VCIRISANNTSPKTTFGVRGFCVSLLSSLDLSQSPLHVGETIVVLFVVSEKLLYPWPDDDADKPIENDDQKNLELPVRGVSEQRPKCLVFHQR
jgi:hypothetical protein